jgi:hypothetical protein
VAAGWTGARGTEAAGRRLAERAGVRYDAAMPRRPKAPPKPAEKLDPAAWKAAALSRVDGPTTMRHSAMMKLYILGASPDEAAEHANTDIRNRRVTMGRPGRGRR